MAFFAHQPVVYYEKARKRDVAIMKRGWDMGTNGKATWTRDELHERSVR